MDELKRYRNLLSDILNLESMATDLGIIGNHCELIGDEDIENIRILKKSLELKITKLESKK